MKLVIPQGMADLVLFVLLMSHFLEQSSLCGCYTSPRPQETLRLGLAALQTQDDLRDYDRTGR